jgi:uncharacterized protein (TIGR03435 family)
MFRKLTRGRHPGEVVACLVMQAAITSPGIACTLAFTLAASPVRVAAQDQAPVFEVASIRPSQVTATSGPASASLFRASPSGIVTYTNYSVRSMIMQAYGIDWTAATYALEGGPPGVLSARFDIRAKVPLDLPTIQATDPEASVAATAHLMLRTLLAEHFRLRAHTETRQLRILALIVAQAERLGPELRPSTHDCDVLRAARAKDPTTAMPMDAKKRPLCTVEVLRAPDATASGARAMAAQVDRGAGPVARLLPALQGFADRPLRDATGLTGNFEWQITRAFPGLGPSDYPSLPTALEEQLGLKLEPRTVAVDVLVIDSLELPTAERTR